MKYVGEIIDRSWFNDKTHYTEGTYVAFPVLISQDDLPIENQEWYAPLMRFKRIYLDEYPECYVLTKNLNNLYYFFNRFGKKT